jgi:membrane-bound lytic murein transglycosylase B
MPVTAAAEERGWSHLIVKLGDDGIPGAYARSILDDHRVPPFTGLDFKLEPRESSSSYRRFRTARDIEAARRCRSRYDAEFHAAEKRLGVPASVLSAILHVETHCGGNTGKSVILYRLARLAMANEPDNVERNIERHTRGLSGARAQAVVDRVRARARAIEALFYPEVVAIFRLGEQTGIDPLALRGSPSGAFGLPQFLPTSYLRFGLDGDGDGKVDLYEPADAIASAANFLHAHGWRAAVPPARQRKVIWAYNRSDAYIDAVLFLAERIDRARSSRPTVVAAAEHQRAARKSVPARR